MDSVALFVTCLVDQLYPRVGEAAVELLEQAGFRVEFPSRQTCCGQPLANMGHGAQASSLMRRFVEIFERYPAVVTPSGSCASMTRGLALELFEHEPEWQSRLARLGERTFELSEFLAARDFTPQRRFEGRVAYHPSCHLLRELHVDGAPRELLARVEGLELVELDDGERCCGFGGAFSVKLPALSAAIMEDKLDALERSGADFVTAADVGCLMHLGGALTRRGSRVRTLHIAELLAGAGEPRWAI